MRKIVEGPSAVGRRPSLDGRRSTADGRRPTAHAESESNWNFCSSKEIFNIKIDHNADSVLGDRTNDNLDSTCLNNYRCDNNTYFKTIKKWREETKKKRKKKKKEKKEKKKKRKKEKKKIKRIKNKRKRKKGKNKKIKRMTNKRKRKKGKNKKIKGTKNKKVEDEGKVMSTFMIQYRWLILFHTDDSKDKFTSI
ncbi:myb-like protein X [Vespula maculifrons]|uniref:Myb-like protein X n=1 Tax=Vespula maculifrons TaxID=7453 RepID=A0ABD2ASE2_VESMC